jgi:dihydrofolate reductase
MVKKVIGIIAVDPNGLIGIDNRLPWYCPSDLDNFRRVTYGQVVVMGRKTFETIPRYILTDRIPIVFSRNKLNSCFNNNIQCTIVSSIQEFLSIQSDWRCNQLFVIGGAQIMHLFLEYNLIFEFIITKIHKSYKGNIYFNLALLDGWCETILTYTQDYTICKLTV